jgi:hypothetical protein
MTVVITDSFEIKSGRPGSEHAAGLVVVFSCDCTDSIPSVGFAINVRTPSGQVFELLVDEMKEHGGARSFFFHDLHKSDVPIGSQINWNDDRSKWQRRVRQAIGRD